MLTLNHAHAFAKCNLLTLTLTQRDHAHAHAALPNTSINIPSSSAVLLQYVVQYVERPPILREVLSRYYASPLTQE